MPALHLIELFSGTSSFAVGCKQASEAAGYLFRSLSIDIHPSFNPSVCVDILTWNYKGDLAKFLPSQRLPGDLVWVHASPPCNEYSYLKAYSRDFERADGLVKRALEIISYVKPTFWTLENPVGMLKTRPFMQRLEAFKQATTYCMFGRPYRKNTNIWTNVPVTLPACKKGSYCFFRQTRRKHPLQAALQPTEELYSIPLGLSCLLVTSALNACAEIEERDSGVFGQ